MPGIGVWGGGLLRVKMKIRLGLATDFLWAKVDARMIDSLGKLKVLCLGVGCWGGMRLGHGA